MDSLQVHLLQLCSVDSLQANLNQVISLVENIQPQSQAGLIALPENALYFRIRPDDKLPRFTLQEPFWELFKKLAHEKNCYIHVGSVPLDKGHQKLFNASVLVTPAGTITSNYDKIFLFDIHLESGTWVRESDNFSPGQSLNHFEINDWKIGQTICYDIRFSEIFKALSEVPVDVILIPSSFLPETGQAHWHVLNRARAIETQSYVVAAAQAGAHRSTLKSEPILEKVTYGHSLVVDPWGKVLLDAGPEEVGCHSITLIKQNILSVRKQIPMREHRQNHPQKDLFLKK